MFQIRRATINDSAGIARVQVDSYRAAYTGIFSQAYLDHFSYAEQAQDWYDWMMTNPHDLLFVAETEAGEIVGYALGRPGMTEIPPYESELIALHVRQSHQKQGVGESLVKTMAAQLQELGCVSMMLWVLAKNPARQFYEKLGGRQVGERTVEMGEGEKAVEVAYGWADTAGLLVNRFT